MKSAECAAGPGLLPHSPGPGEHFLKAPASPVVRETIPMAIITTRVPVNVNGTTGVPVSVNGMVPASQEMLSKDRIPP